MSQSITSEKSAPAWWRRLGPGLITGAADDDPSGIATYSQAGAQFGLGMLWTVILTYPFMAAFQGICARIGRVTGKGLAANMLLIMPQWSVTIIVVLLFAANSINIGADIAAMGAAAHLLFGWGESFFAILLALVSLVLQVFVPYHRYVHVLKWLTLALFAYVGVLFSVHIDWGSVARNIIWPEVQWDHKAFTMVVAVFGTTISPYLFFWQSSEEVEDVEQAPGGGPLLETSSNATSELNRIGFDTYVGMAVSNIAAFMIVLSTGVTLHEAGMTNIETSAQAAEALRPIAGDFAFLLFSIGIIGTGLLALPVLAGSAAYAICELKGWRKGLEQDLQNAKPFYSVISLGFLLGLSILLLPISPFEALFWTAVINGVIAVPIMAATMVVASNRKHLGPFVAPVGQRLIGWLATLLMAGAALAMLI